MLTNLLGQSETNWWTRAFRSESDQAGELRWQWMNLPESWGVFVWLLLFALLIGGAIWLYRRESSICPPRIRAVLALLRVLVLLFLLLLLFKPSIYFQQVNILRPTFALLRDESLSLAQIDQYTDAAEIQKLSEATGIDAALLKNGSVSRTEILNRTLHHNNDSLLTALRKKGAIQVIDFSDRLNPIALLPATLDDKNKQSTNANDGDATTENIDGSNVSLPDLKSEGLGTDLWQALGQTLDDTKRLAGIILVSEGQHNGSEDPVEIAKRASERDVPIFVIGIGDPTPTRNLSVLQVNSPARAYLNEPFFIEAVLQASLPSDDPARTEPFDVTLLQQKLDPRTGKPGDAAVIESKQVSLPEAGNRVRVQFSHSVSEQGKFVYTVRASEFDNETLTKDNESSTGTIEVVDQKIRVLLVSGLPNWDYIQLNRLLQRDSTISVSCWLQSMDETRQQEGDEPIVQLPRTLEDLGQYNVIVLIDPNPEEFDESWIDALKEFCRIKAGGVIYMAGPHFSAEFLSMNRLSGIREILPVRFGDANEIAASQVLADATGDRGGSMQIVSFNLEHDIMKLGEENEQVQNIWSRMPGFVWNFPTLAAKPTARVLLERGDEPSFEGNQPMLVDGRFGAGTILYFGFQGSWRWRQIGLQAQYFNSFWIQTIRYLVEHRSLQGSRRGFVDSDQIEYEMGSNILLLANLVDEQFRPSTAENIDVVITDENGRRQKVALQKVPGQEGKFELNFKANRTGSFTASFDIATEEEQALFEPATYRVTPPKIETSATWRNEKLLRDIAEQSGGKYFSIEDMSQVAAVLPDLEKRIEFDSPPQPAWDLNRWFRGLAFLFPVALLALEWTIRKWNKLL